MDPKLPHYTRIWPNVFLWTVVTELHKDWLSCREEKIIIRIHRLFKVLSDEWISLFFFLKIYGIRFCLIIRLDYISRNAFINFIKLLISYRNVTIIYVRFMIITINYYWLSAITRMSLNIAKNIWINAICLGFGEIKINLIFVFGCHLL